MESTKHPDQNPEEVQSLNQEENSQQENAVNTVEESSSPIENAVAETEIEVPAEVTEAEVAAELVTTVIEEPVQTEEVAETVALSEPELDSEPEVIAEPEVAAVAETISETEVVAEQEVIVEPVIVTDQQEVAEPEVVVTAEIAAEAIEVSELEVTPELATDETTDEAIDEVIEAEVAAAELVDIDYGHMDREQLVALLEETVQNEDVNIIKSKVAQIKVAYLALANKERQELYQNAAASEEAENFEVVDPLEERFKAAFGIYKHNKFRFTEDQEKIKVQNLDAKKKILDELKVLINSEETLKKTYDEFKALQDTWKGIGMVPKTEAQGLWQNYHFLIEKFFDKVKINKELKDLDLRKNLERKIELCEKAEELVLEPSITQSFKRLQELHEEWKEVGPVAQDKREEVWDRFKTATEKINDRRHEFYKQIQGDLEANHAAKVLLCEKAEQLVATEFNSIKQWQDSTHQVNELLKMWKSVGQAPQKVNNEIWNRFKAQLDLYFSNKKEYFGKLKDQQLNNYNLKVEQGKRLLEAETVTAATSPQSKGVQWAQKGPRPACPPA